MWGSDGQDPAVGSETQQQREGSRKELYALPVGDGGLHPDGVRIGI